MDAYRKFFASIFSDTDQRRKILKQWHARYPADKKRHTRLASVFEEFLGILLYDPVKFKLRQNHFCFFDSGSDALSVWFIWLTDEQREFIINTVFAQRKTIFTICKETESEAQFNFDGFIYNVEPRNETFETICDPIWRRELARDFAWLIVGQKDQFLVLELIVAIQGLRLNRKPAKRDVFLVNLEAGLQGRCNVREVLCWGMGPFDLHSEDVYQRKKYNNKNAPK